MANFFKDNEDLQYYLDKGLDWERIVAITEYDFRAADGHKDTAEALEFYRDIAGMVGEFVAEEIAPHLAPEAKMALGMVATAVIREIYSRTDGQGAVLVLEADSLEAAHALLADLPLVKHKLLKLEFYPVTAYPAIAALADA